MIPCPSVAAAAHWDIASAAVLAEQFTYWLQGFVENGGARPSERQWASIKDHLKLVFEKETPNRNTVQKAKRIIEGLAKDPPTVTPQMRFDGTLRRMDFERKNREMK